MKLFVAALVVARVAATGALEMVLETLTWPAGKPAFRGARDAAVNFQARVPKAQGGSEDRDLDNAEIQFEVESMIKRLSTIHDQELAVEFARELEGMEAALNGLVKNKGLRHEVTAMRADLCAQRGFKAHEFADCDAFMRRQCRNVQRTKSVPLRDCRSYFAEDLASATHLTAKAKRSAADAEGAADAFAAAVAAAPGPGGAPGPAPAPGPGLFGGKFYRPLPEQGYHGKYVVHTDQETMVGDWATEFGPEAGHSSFTAICDKHPGNEWCRLHGYGRVAAVARPQELKAGAQGLSVMLLPLLALLLLQ